MRGRDGPRQGSDGARRLFAFALLWVALQTTALPAGEATESPPSDPPVPPFTAHYAFESFFSPPDLRSGAAECSGAAWAPAEHEDPSVWEWHEAQGIRSECWLGTTFGWVPSAGRATLTFDWSAEPPGESPSCVPRTDLRRTLTVRAIDTIQGPAAVFDSADVHTDPPADAAGEAHTFVIDRGARTRDEVLVQWVARDNEPDAALVGPDDACMQSGFRVSPRALEFQTQQPLVNGSTSRVTEVAERMDGYRLGLSLGLDDRLLAQTDDIALSVQVPHERYRLHSLSTPSGTYGLAGQRAERTAEGLFIRVPAEAAAALVPDGGTLVVVDVATAPDSLLVSQSLPLRSLLFAVPLGALATAAYETVRYVQRAGDRQRGRVICYVGANVVMGTILAAAAVPTVVEDRLYEFERGLASAALTWGLVGLASVAVAALSLRAHLRRRAIPRLDAERAREREAQERIAARSEELEHFVAGLGHDLKTPLIALDWLTKDIEEELRAGEPEEVRATVERIRRNVGGMDRLVKDLLELTRIEKGEHDDVPVDLREVLEDVVGTVEDAARRRGAALSVDQGSLPVLVGDHALWRQVFQNLVGNAVKYGREEGGHVYVRAVRLRDGRVRLEVEDDGPGVPADEKETIFEVFRRGSTGLSQTGTGLGLALVRKIVQRYGGSVRVEDGEGSGSRFVVELPADRVVDRHQPSEEASGAFPDPGPRSAPGAGL